MREDKEGSGLLIEAARYPTLYSSRAAQRRVQRRPNFQTGIANFRIRPRRSATETRLPESRKIGEERGERAFNLPRHPARMSARAREKSIETCAPGQEMPRTWRPAGRGGGFMRPLRSVARQLHVGVHRLFVCVVCRTASVRSRRERRRSRGTCWC